QWNLDFRWRKTSNRKLRIENRKCSPRSCSRPRKQPATTAGHCCPNPPPRMVYLWAFLIGVGFDLVPIIGPPVWTGLVLLVMKFDANPWLVLACGVPGSVLGRYCLSLYTPWLAKKVIKQRKNDEMQFVGRKLK